MADTDPPDTDPPYVIDFDPHRRIVSITTAGFWSVSTMASFVATAMARGTAIRLRHGQFAVLADMRAAPIQPADTMPLLDTFMRKSVALTTAPIAAVVGSTLGKLQAQRVLTQPNCRIFLDLGEARAWLDREWTSRLPR